jgi:hypothetical protein
VPYLRKNLAEMMDELLLSLYCVVVVVECTPGLMSNPSSHSSAQGHW